MSRALVLLAEGAEEMEAVIIVDTLRRAQWEVVLASVESDAVVTCSRGMQLVADALLADIDDPLAFDHIILPGGAGGTQRLRENQRVQDLLKAQARAGQRISAICAAPLALQEAGLTHGAHITSHPAVRDEFEDCIWSNERVVRDGLLLTSQGPGTAFEFALALIDEEGGAALTETVRPGLILP